ncbi:hypothetical protein N7507_002739 [Penicillium longicatenatum]|nr:hypothetical protein N7507_002739 [Penicillium longicatenatum]
MVPGGGPVIGTEMLRPCIGLLSLFSSLRPDRDRKYIRKPRAHSTGTPTPTPTPITILLVVVKPEEEEPAEDAATASVDTAETEDAGVARLDVFSEVAVAAVAVVVVVVVGSSMIDQSREAEQSM